MSGVLQPWHLIVVLASPTCPASAAPAPGDFQFCGNCGAALARSRRA